jgi:outer membrane protein assembly factor BamD (BamD/ComL family)
LLKTPPSRNDALLWMARNFIEQDQLIDAAALLTLLKTDINYPSRLNPFYNELQAYIFYKQEQWDSAGVYFEKALDNADNRQDLARREYLLAQILTKANKNKEASHYYNKASKHTTNLLMAIFADLNEAQLVRGSDEKDIKATIEDLLKMAHRDKYDAYRDLLYYSAAKLQLQIKDTAGAVKSYQKSIDKTVPPPFEYYNKSYLQLSDIAFAQKNYRIAASLIDSVQLADESVEGQQEEIEKRKFILHQIARRAGMIEREDSLQKLAKLPEAELESYLKKLVRRLRKEKGLKEEPVVGPLNPAVTKAGGGTTGGDLFGGGNNDKGDWYFYNPAAKARGFTEFKAKWGKRPNADDWRRMGAVSSNLTVNNGGQTDNKEDSAYDKSNGEISIDALKANIPFTKEQLEISNDTVSSSLYDLGGIYKNALEDYKAAAETYEELYQRFPADEHSEETVFNLYYCYLKAGDLQKSNYYKNLLNSEHAKSNYNKTITEYEKGGGAKIKSPVTQKYEEIYDLMLEGKFEQALEQKQQVEQDYPDNKWTPQLLYIEALYHIKQRNDSLANGVLDDIIANFPTSPLFEKAQTMKEVLAKRSEIENYLTNLEITRNQEEQVVVPEEVKNLTTTKNETNLDAKPKQQQVTAQQDKPKVTQPVKVEAKKDSVAVKPAAEPIKAYAFNPQLPHLVLMILEKVDGIYVNESRNAFNRYNSSYHGNEDIQVSGIKLDDTTSINIFTQFPDALKATDYALELKERTKQIVPWLKGGKYSYIIITAENLDLLKTRKSVAEYRRFLEQYLPGKF